MSEDEPFTLPSVPSVTGWLRDPAGAPAAGHSLASLFCQTQGPRWMDGGTRICPEHTQAAKGREHFKGLIAP